MTTRRTDGRDATKDFEAKKEYIGRLFNMLEGLADDLDITSGDTKHWAHVGTLANTISKLEEAAFALGSASRKFDIEGDALTWIDRNLERNVFYSKAAARWVTVPRD